MLKLNQDSRFKINKFKTIQMFFIHELFSHRKLRIRWSENKQFSAIFRDRATKWGQEDSGRVRQEFISSARSRAADDTSPCFIAVREILSGVNARGNAVPSRSRSSDGLKRKREEKRPPGRRRSANVPIRMFFVFFVSRLVCSTAIRRKEGVPDGHEGRRWSRRRGWRALIYRGNRSLFLSRRLSRPPRLDRYRLVIAFRYLNISAWWNLSDEIGGICGMQEASCQNDA